jgi:predicted alpha/beta superfamily hydrolase
MIKSRFLMITVVLAISSALLGVQEPDSTCTKVGFVTSLDSKNLEQTRKLFIHLPDGYEKGMEYPMVVLLDGEATFRAFAAATALMAWQGLIPQCIVVGIPNINRELDYAPVIEGIPGTGTAEKMKAFYRDELFPFLEARYPAGKRILYGHSWVGFFATWVMLTDPSLFDAYIASSPMFRFYPQIFGEEGIPDGLQQRETGYYLTLGGEEVLSRELEAFIALLEAQAPESLHWKFVRNEGRGHDSNALLSYMDGILFLLGSGE